MKKMFQSLVVILASYVAFFFPQQVLAQIDDFANNGVNQQLLDDANPLKITGSEYADQLSTPGGIISRVLVFAFPLAGLILFVMLIWGGFETVMQSAGKKSVEAGRQRITAAIVGFVLLFVSYWIIRVIETVFGIVIFV